jgi:Glycosyl hydrolase family 12
MSVEKSPAAARNAAPRAPHRPNKRVIRALFAVALGFALLGACSTPNTGNGPDNGGGSSGGSGGSNGSSGGNGGGSNSGGNGGSNSGGSGGSGASSGNRGGSSGASSGGASSGVGSSGTGSSGAGGSSGASSGSGSSGGGSGADAGDGGPVCTNMDRSVLQEDKTGFIFQQCNEYTIQGSWYCFSDQQAQANGGQEGCVQGVVPYVAGKGMCLQGTLGAGTSTYAAIGLELNATGGTSSVKRPYDAPSHGITGFTIGLTGTTSETLRIGFTDPRQSTTTGSYVAPYYTATQLTGTTATLQVPFSSVPPVNLAGVGSFGQMIEPNMLEDIQIELAGQTGTQETYNFCITSIVPIFATDGGCAEVSGPGCDVGAVIGPVGNYAVQNNVSMGGSQCVNAMPGSSCSQSGFTVTYPNGNFGVGGNVPSSFPSMIYGWQNGGYYGVSPLPKQLMSIGSANTTWNFSVPGGTTYDAAYDIWLGPTATSGPGNAPGLELMVWEQYSGPTPAGSMVASGATVAGVTGMWDVYKGQVNSWQYLAYRARTQTASVNLDLNNFFKDAAAANKYNVNWNGTALSPSWYLWGVQAGFEVYNASQTITTSSFSVVVQ